MSDDDKDTVLLICDSCDEEYQVPEDTEHCPICGKRCYDIND